MVYHCKVNTRNRFKAIRFLQNFFTIGLKEAKYKLDNGFDIIGSVEDIETREDYNENILIGEKDKIEAALRFDGCGELEIISIDCTEYEKQRLVDLETKRQYKKEALEWYNDLDRKYKDYIDCVLNPGGPCGCS